MNMTRHNVFISYHHANDQLYKEKFVRDFQSYFIDKSVHLGEYAEDLSTQYIKRLIREEKITHSSIIVVLIGSETYKRKHVDWEIAAGLTCKAGGCSGLVGILLPTYYDNPQNYFLTKGHYLYETIPPRLADNIKTKYADIYTWDYLYQQDYCGNYLIGSILDNAFNQKCCNSDNITNDRVQFSYNRA